MNENTNNLAVMAAQFNIQPEQLMQLMAMLQTMQQATPAPEQSVRTVPELRPRQQTTPAPAQEQEQAELAQEQSMWIPIKELIKERPTDSANVIDSSLIEKFAPLTQGDTSCVTAEADFKKKELYGTLYSTLFMAEPITDATRENCIYELKKTAQTLGGRALVSLFKTRCDQEQVKKEGMKKEAEERKMEEKKQAEIVHGKQTRFADLPESCTGNKFVAPEWDSNNTEVWTTVVHGKEIRKETACTQPVLINRQLEPIDGIEDVRRVELMYRDGKKWRTSFEELETLFNANKVLTLANKGIAITKKNASDFSEFMASMYQESVDRDALPALRTMTKLGWSKDKKIFMPCVTGETEVLFDRREQFSSLLDTLKPAGKSEVWYQEFKKLRQTRYLPFLLLTAAALAAPIVGMTNLDGFVFNIHSATTTGKSYSTAMVMTLWGFAGLGSELFMSAKATTNGYEIKLDALNNIPLVIEDTAALNPKQKAAFQEFVMDAANGRGKTRATKSLGLQRQRTWRTVTIVTSEGAVDSGYTTGGSRARVIKFLSTEKFPLWDEMAQIAEVMEHNYGYGGRDMILALQKLGEPEVKRLIEEFNKKLKNRIKESGKNKQDRQIISAALMMTADYIAEKYLFKDGILLNIDDVIDMLDDANKINQAARMYESLVEKIYTNRSHIEGFTDDISGIRDPYWGVYDREKQTMSFLPDIWHQLLKEADMNEEQFILYLRQQGLLIADTGAQAKTNSKVLNGRPRVYKIILPDTNAEQANSILDRIAACLEASYKDGVVSIPADVMRNSDRAAALGFTECFDVADFVSYMRSQEIMITQSPEENDVWSFKYSRPKPTAEEERKKLASGRGDQPQPKQQPVSPQPQPEQLKLPI